MTRSTARGFGVYVHVPFCASRCDYCDFATWTDRAHLIDDYVDACVRDIERRSPAPRHERVLRRRHAVVARRTHGSPRILDAIPRADDAEVTVECNPDSVDRGEAARRTARPGVNRVSFGVQSMRAHVLLALGRTHDPANVARAVERRARRRHRPHQPRPHLRHAGRVDRRLGGHARRRARARARARQRVRAHGRAGHAARARRSPPGERAGARRRRPGDASTSSPTTGSPPPGSPGTRSRTGPGPATSAATTSSTGSGATTPRSAAPPTATAAGSPLVERAHARSLRRRGRRRRSPGGRRRGARRRPRRAARPWCSRCEPRAGSSSGAPPADPSPSVRVHRRARDDRAAGPGRGDRVVLTRRGRLLGERGRGASPRSRSNSRPHVAGTR